VSENENIIIVKKKVNNHRIASPSDDVFRDDELLVVADRLRPRVDDTVVELVVLFVDDALAFATCSSFNSSSVRISCSPGRIQNIGPSSLSAGLGMSTADHSPHGINGRRNGHCSSTRTSSSK